MYFFSFKSQATFNCFQLLCISDSPLEHIISFTYLGLTHTCKLSWSTHIQKTCSKARRLISLIYTHFYQHSSSDSLQNVYTKHLFSPSLHNYCSVVGPFFLLSASLVETQSNFCAKNIPFIVPTRTTHPLSPLTRPLSLSLSLSLTPIMYIYPLTLRGLIPYPNLNS